MKRGARLDARQRRRLDRLVTIADLHAQAGRARLAAASAVEAQAHAAFNEIQRARQDALAGLATDPPPDAGVVAATGRWMRWQEREARDRAIEFARSRAETEMIRAAAGRDIARHEVLRRLLDCSPKLHPSDGDQSGC